MKKKIISMLICILFISSINVLAGNMNDPEITDVTGDAFGYLDIHSVWFYEEEDNPDFLFVAMKINEPSYNKFQQTFAIFWRYEDKQYACGLHLGFDIQEDWESYTAGEYNNRAPRGGSKNYHINGTYSTSEGIILWKIEKEFIGLILGQMHLEDLDFLGELVSQDQYLIILSIGFLAIHFGIMHLIIMENTGQIIY